MSLADVLKWLVIAVALPLNWIVAGLLWRLSLRASDATVLRDRAIAATAVAVLVTIFAIVFLNNDLVVPVLSFEQTKVYTRGACLGLSVVPALFWLRLYWNER